jgi:hypothetical protein
MIKKRKASSLETFACHLATTLLTASQRSQREIATSDNDSGAISSHLIS